MILSGLFNLKREVRDANLKIQPVVEWPDHIVTLEGNNFNKFIEKYPISIVDFWAPWCAPCRAMASRLRRVSKIYKKKVAFGKLNTQKNQDIVKQYKIIGIPHLIFFRYGKTVTTLTGLKSIGDIKNVIDNLLKKIDKRC